jgi:glycosyltransferase involved in cell wall biosynthesis
MKNKLDIIIALKNNSKELALTLESIRAQSVINEINIIVVDCNSIDDPKSIVDAYANCFSISFLSEYDTGIYNAWNKAIRLSQSSWVTFFGAGDIFTDNALLKMLDYADNNPSMQIISSKTKNFYNNKRARVSGKPFKYSEFSTYFSINHSGLMYKREVFNRFGNFNENYKSSSDYEFLLRSSPYLKFGFLDFVVSEYSYGGISSSSYLPLIETYKIRKKYRTVSPIKNSFLFLYGCFAFMYRK